MAYATLQNAKDLYGDEYVLSSIDRDRDGNVDVTAFNSSLDKASNIIDSYLSTRYDVPVSPVLEILIQYEIDIAIYYSSHGLAMTEEKDTKYKEAIKWLKAVSKGEANLGLDEPSSDQQNNPQTTSNTRLFTRTKMNGLF